MYELSLARLIVRRVAYWRRNAIAKTWPMTQATVESGAVTTDEAPFSHAEIAYSYSVANNYYSGFHERVFVTKEAAWRFIDAFKGKAVVVNYNPQEPGISTLTDAALRGAVSDPSILRWR